VTCSSYSNLQLLDSILQHLDSTLQHLTAWTAAPAAPAATCNFWTAFCSTLQHQQHLLDSNIKTQGQQLLLISTPPGTKPAGQQHFHPNLQQVDSNITWEHACLLPFPNRQNEK